MIYTENDFSVRPCGGMTSTKDKWVIDCLPKGGYLDTHGKIVPAATAMTDIYSLIFRSKEAAQFEVNRFMLIQTINKAKDGDCIPVKDSKLFTVAEQHAEKIRKFDTGAIRDTDSGKLSYSKGLSFLVLRRYLQYLGKHRTLSDGSTRDWDNWKKGISPDVYRDSLTRHVADVNIVADGHSAEDNHGSCNVEDLLCAVIFNAQGWLFELLKKRGYGNETRANNADNNDSL